jgi:hypothetical protein
MMTRDLARASAGPLPKFDETTTTGGRNDGTHSGRIVPSCRRQCQEDRCEPCASRLDRFQHCGFSSAPLQGVDAVAGLFEGATTSA